MRGRVTGPDGCKGPPRSVRLGGLGKGRSNCGLFVCREHGGPEGMDPDGVIEVRRVCGFGNSGKVSLFILFTPPF